MSVNGKSSVTCAATAPRRRSSVCSRRKPRRAPRLRAAGMMIAVAATCGQAGEASGRRLGLIDAVAAPLGELLPARLAHDRAELDPLAAREPHGAAAEVEAERGAVGKQPPDEARELPRVVARHSQGQGLAIARVVRGREARRGGTFGAELRQLPLHGARRGAEPLERRRAHGIGVPDQREQEVLGLDLPGAERRSEAVGPACQLVEDRRLRAPCRGAESSGEEQQAVRDQRTGAPRSRRRIRAAPATRGWSRPGRRARAAGARARRASRRARRLRDRRAQGRRTGSSPTCAARGRTGRTTASASPFATPRRIGRDMSRASSERRSGW